MKASTQSIYDQTHANVNQFFNQLKDSFEYKNFYITPIFINHAASSECVTCQHQLIFK